MLAFTSGSMIKRSDDDVIIIIILKKMSILMITLQVVGSHWHSYSSGKKGSTDVGSRTLVQNFHVMMMAIH